LSPAATRADADRPIGLSVAPMGNAWQVSWNSNATALRDARSAHLFVRNGDDQNRIDLTPKDLEQGMYRYDSQANDLTFRLEVVESSGAVSAESFRFQRDVKVEAPKPPTLPPALPPVGTATPESPGVASGRITEPKVIQREPPVVAAGLRPRIDGSATVDVRVRIDSRGRVVSAAPVRKPRPGLDTILARAAVTAARMWRFEPARQNGKPIPFSQTIHFVFEK
jgi:TonB family protein